MDDCWLSVDSYTAQEGVDYGEIDVMLITGEVNQITKVSADIVEL